MNKITSFTKKYYSHITCCFISLAGIIEATLIMLQTYPNINYFPYFYSILFCLLIALLPTKNRVLPYTIIILWSTSDILSFFFPIPQPFAPPSTVTAVIISISIIAYNNVLIGTIFSFFPVFSTVLATTLQGTYLHWIFSTLLQTISWTFSSVLLGYFARYYTTYVKYQEQQIHQKNLEIIRQSLHDAAANKLSYLISFINLNNSEVTLSEVNEVITSTLDDIRHCISLTDTINYTNKNTNGISYKYSLIQISKICQKYDYKIKVLGYKSINIINNEIGEASITIKNDINLLLSEIFNNIRKYADPKYPFIISFSISKSKLVLSATNHVNSKSTDSGHNLISIKNWCTSANAKFDIVSSNELWEIIITIPIFISDN